MKPLSSIIEDPVEETLVILNEECSEVIKEVCKVQRFGLDHVGPAGASAGNVPARAFLAHELGQLQEMIDIARRAGIVASGPFDNGRRDKREKLATWSSLPKEWLTP